MTKILVIDDKKDNLVAVKAILKNLEPEYEVLTAQSGIAGIKLAKSKQPDMILLDVHMPRIDGYEVCRRLRADKKTEHIPIIFLTAVKISSNDKIKGLELGGDAYLTKPIDEGELLANLHAMLRIKKVEDELEREKDLLEVKVIERTRELRESEARYIDLYENAPDMFVSVDAKTSKILRCNQTLVKSLGYKKDEIIGQRIFFVYHPDCLEGVNKAFQQFVDTGEIHDAELQLKRKDGSKIEVSLNVSAVRDKSGKVVYSRSIWRDITERKLAEDALRNSESKLKRAQNIAQLGIWEWNLKTDKGIWSKQMYSILGYKREEIEISFEWLLKQMHTDDKERVSNEIMEAVNKQKLIDMEYRIYRKDGSECTVHSIGEVKLDETGKTIGMEGTIQDITERKQAEDKLRVSEEKFRTLFEDSRDAIYISSKEGSLVDFNKSFERLFGFSREELFSLSTEELYANPDKRLDFRQTISPQGFVKDYELSLKKKDNTIIDCLLSTSVKKDPAGNIVGYQGIIRDITAQKKAEAAIKESEEQFQNLFNSMREGFALCEVICDKKGIPIDYRFLKINPAFGKQSGMNVQTSLGKTIIEIYPDIEFTWIERYGRVAITQEAIHFEDYNHNTKKYYDAMAFSPSKGKFAMLFKDITKRKQAEQELIKKMDKLDRFNKLMVGRELKMAELKREVNELLEKAGLPEKYSVPGDIKNNSGHSN